MSEDSGNNDVTIRISMDRMEARLLIPAESAADEDLLERCRAALETADVEITSEALERLESLVQTVSAGDEAPAREGFVVARGVAPQNGEDGKIEWLVEATEEAASAREGDLASISYYDRSPFIFVDKGQHIANRAEPTDGVEGRDVTGAAIPAAPGKPCPVSFDDSIISDNTGRCFAQLGGVLEFERGAAAVRPALNVRENVDFNTGNINFEGDVLVRGGVRDCFRIRARGDVDIKGLIEAAVIECEGDLYVRTGMAGRGKGSLRVGGNAMVRYLDDVSAEISGDLHADRELINCRLEIGGGILSDRSSIIGGQVNVTGALEVASIGSDFGVETEITLGSSPLVENKLGDLKKAMVRLQSEQADLEGRLAQLESLLHDPMTEEQEAQVSTMTAQRDKRAAQISDLQAATDTLQGMVDACGDIHFTIFRTLHSGVVMRFGDQCYRVDEDVKGPLHIGLDPEGEPVFQRGSSPPQPLTLIARPWGGGDRRAA